MLIVIFNFFITHFYFTALTYKRLNEGLKGDAKPVKPQPPPPPPPPVNRPVKKLKTSMSLLSLLLLHPFAMIFTKV